MSDERAYYIVAGILTVSLFFYDATGPVSLGDNAIALSFVAALLLYAGLRGEPDETALSEGNAPELGAGGWMTGSLALEIKNALRGSHSSRRQLAKTLVYCHAVRSAGVLHPDYEALSAAEAELKAMARDDKRLLEVLQPVQGDEQPGRIASPRLSRDEPYLRDLESAIRLTREGGR